MKPYHWGLGLLILLAIIWVLGPGLGWINITIN